MIGHLLAAYEGSALGEAARSTVWLYPVLNLAHVLGAALLVGAVVAFDLAVLRRSPDVGRIGRATLPLAGAGLALQLVTGALLFAAEATTMAVNPAFQAKLAAIVLGIANLAWFRRRYGAAIAQGIVPPGAPRGALVSMAAWVLALLAGRGIAYL